MNELRGLDAYITGVNIHAEDMVLHRCPKCGEEKELEMFFDMGGWFYTPEAEDELECVDCQVEMRIVK